MSGRIGAVLLLLVSVGSRASSPSAPLSPTGKWVADFAETTCILSRAYGTEKAPFTLAFEKFPMMDGITLYVFRKSRGEEVRSGKAQVSFGGGTSKSVDYDAFSIDGTSRRIEINIKDNSYRIATESGSVSMVVPGETNQEVLVPAFADALKVLNDCAADLGMHWGIGTEVQAKLRTPAQPIEQAQELFKGSDYPSQALEKLTTGRTRVKVDVDESGLPTRCEVLQSSGDESLDQRSCAVFLKRSRYKPALDNLGRPMRGLDVATIYWLLR